MTTLRVRYAETDQAGVAYHANYLHWFEVGRTEMLRDLGVGYARMEREKNLLLTVVEAGLHYQLPAHYDDVLVVESQVRDVRRVRFRIETAIRRQASEEVLCTGHVWLACVTRDGRPVALPRDLQECLLRLGQEEGGKRSAEASVTGEGVTRP